MEKLELQKIANEVRKDIVTAVHAAKAGHPGGSLSAADLFTYLYFQEMNIDPKDPKKADRDRFVLSKGHTAPGLYSALADSIDSPFVVAASAGIAIVVLQRHFLPLPDAGQRFGGFQRYQQ